MVEASRKYNRVVQLGTQTRSAPYAAEAVDYIRSGKLGDVHLVRVFNMKGNSSIGRKEDATTPDGVDYDMWLGPAPKRPFNPNRFHGAWYYRWDYSNGDIINDGIHQIDLARWIVGHDYPDHVTATGGMFHFDDDQETPDTLVATYAYPKLTMTFELTLWTPYMEKIALDIRESEEKFPDWMFCATRIEVHGSNGLMMFGRHGGGWHVFGPDRKIAAQKGGLVPLIDHVDNFYKCIREGGKANADIQEGHRSTLLAHLANVSYKVGSRTLRIDKETEQIIDDPEAQALAKRTFREPWVMPDKV